MFRLDIWINGLLVSSRYYDDYEIAHMEYNAGREINRRHPEYEYTLAAVRPIYLTDMQREMTKEYNMIYEDRSTIKYGGKLND